MISPNNNDQDKPLADLDEWDDDLRRRYPEPASAESQPKSQFTDENKKKE